ncbi:unnamed protein product, partial [Choristocarpus tenellus]
MGTILPTLINQDEPTGVVTLKAILNEYEAMKADQRETPFSDLEIYRGLERELIMTLGLGAKFNVLVVDDSQISWKLARRALAMPHFYTEVAQTGMGGLEMLTQNPSKYDLVLLDIIMPGLNGIEVLTQMKQNSQLSRIPVAMLSGNEDQSLVEECLARGAVDVLLKPLRTEEVLKIAKKHSLGQPIARGHLKGGHPRVAIPRHDPTEFVASSHQHKQPREALDNFPHSLGLGVGDTVPDFVLMDKNSEPFKVSTELNKTGGQLLFAFFPGAFLRSGWDSSSPQGKGHGMMHSGRYGVGKGNVEGEAMRHWRGSVFGEEMLTMLNNNLEEIRATGTSVVGVGRESPPALKAFSTHLRLDFPVISDPSLELTEKLTGLFNLKLFQSLEGCPSPEMSRYKAGRQGIVLLNKQGLVQRKWVATDASGKPNASCPLDIE